MNDPWSRRELWRPMILALAVASLIVIPLYLALPIFLVAALASALGGGRGKRLLRRWLKTS